MHEQREGVLIWRSRGLQARILGIRLWWGSWWSLSEVEEIPRWRDDEQGGDDEDVYGWIYERHGGGSRMSVASSKPGLAS